MKFPYLATCLIFGIICEGRSNPVNSNTICNWRFNETDDTNEESDSDYQDDYNDNYDVNEEEYADYGCITTSSESESESTHNGGALVAIGPQPSCEMHTVFTKRSGQT